MASSIVPIKISYKSTNSVLVGKFTVGILDTSNPGQFLMSSSANAGPVAGVVTDSLLPSGYADYSGGEYITASGATWPTGVNPTSAAGYPVSFAVAPDFEYCIAASAITAGDLVNTAATTTINGVSVMGAVKTVSEATGTLINVVGVAQESATAAGQVILVRLTMQSYTHQ